MIFFFFSLNRVLFLLWMQLKTNNSGHRKQKRGTKRLSESGCRCLIFTSENKNCHTAEKSIFHLKRSSQVFPPIYLPITLPVSVPFSSPFSLQIFSCIPLLSKHIPSNKPSCYIYVHHTFCLFNYLRYWFCLSHLPEAPLSASDFFFFSHCHQ